MTTVLVAQHEVEEEIAVLSVSVRWRERLALHEYITGQAAWLCHVLIGGRMYHFDVLKVKTRSATFSHMYGSVYLRVISAVRFSFQATKS